MKRAKRLGEKGEVLAVIAEVGHVMFLDAYLPYPSFPSIRDPPGTDIMFNWLDL